MPVKEDHAFSVVRDACCLLGLTGPEEPAGGTRSPRISGPDVMGGELNTIAPYSYALDAQMDYDSIFSVVRKAVRFAINRERSGLGLILSDLPAALGAFWEVGGNYIVLNELLVNVMRRMARSERELNSYIFVVLAHEYLHAIGYIDESEVRRATAFVTNKAFGKDHPTTAMAMGDMWQMYPFLRLAEGGRGTRTRVVGKFDTESTRSYIW